MCVKYFATLTPLRTEKTFDANPNVLYSEGNVISLILPRLFFIAYAYIETNRVYNLTTSYTIKTSTPISYSN